MKKIRTYFLIFILPILAFALEVKPWFGDVYEFSLLSKYGFSFFSDINNPTRPINRTYHKNQLYFDLEFPFSPQWSTDIDLQFAESTNQNFGYSSLACQFRYLWFDDIVGDFASLATGGYVRYTARDSVDDFTCYFHGDVEGALNVSLGKEIDYFEYWRYRFWAYGALGLANRGSIWLEGYFGIDGNYEDKHKWSMFVVGSQGYGKDTKLNVDNFKGYGRVRYSFFDLNIRYGYQLGVWGTVRFEYQRRLLAKRFPSNENIFAVSYLLPFSF